METLVLGGELTRPGPCSLHQQMQDKPRRPSAALSLPAALSRNHGLVNHHTHTQTQPGPPTQGHTGGAASGKNGGKKVGCTSVPQ